MEISVSVTAIGKRNQKSQLIVLSNCTKQELKSSFTCDVCQLSRNQI